VATLREQSPEIGSDAPIVFGTSGWRGISGVDFTPARVAAAVHAVARWVAEGSPGAEVVVAHDTRPEGERYVRLACSALCAEGARVVRAQGPTATPVVTRAIFARGASAGLVFSASHNPPEYRGMKVFGPSGGALDRSATDRIEALVADGARREAAPPFRLGELPGATDLVSPYLRDLREQLDTARMRRSGIEVVYDAMHGAGSGVVDRALRECGVDVEILRGASDPRFGGGAPDPTPPRLRELSRRVRDTSGPVVGLATDGDADRFAVVAEDGSVLSETEAVALLVDHLARSGRLEGGVAISWVTGSLVERVAASHGLGVTRCSIGFRHLSRQLESGAAAAAGEESGGFALGRFGRDKDGILASCLIAELAAELAGQIGERVALLHRRHGRSCCGRTALGAEGGAAAALERLLRAPPDRVDSAIVRNASRQDGLYLALDDGFLMLRASGTEPLVRVYAEAPGPRRLARRLAAGESLLTR
jgi:phosphomannomutase